MRVCHTEAMKIIKECEEQKRILLRQEEDNCHTSYKEGEDKLTNGYDYGATRKAIHDLDEKIRKIRAQLALANTQTIVDDFGITLGEALVLLAQLQNEKEHLESLSCCKQLTRRLTQNGIIEYTEALFDIDKVKEDVKSLRKRINDLQMAIDRANLTHYIEI